VAASAPGQSPRNFNFVIRATGLHYAPVEAEPPAILGEEAAAVTPSLRGSKLVSTPARPLGRLLEDIFMTRTVTSAVARPNDDACLLPEINAADAKSPLRWLGNKDPDWKRISPYVRLGRSNSFFEPFGGSAAITFRVLARERRPMTVHIAERIPELRAVIEAIRDNPRGFLKRLPRERCPERYKAWRAILQGGDWKGIDPLTRTAMWFFIKKNAHRAHAGWSGYSPIPVARTAVTSTSESRPR
jgi:hypothetical protein